MKESSSGVKATVVTQNSYDSSVVVRAMARAGRNPHLKGHIHEVLIQDGQNLRGVLRGEVTQLTRSTTAKAVDLVTTKGGKVIGRIQAKDVLSDSGVKKIVQQVSDGKYRSVKLVGTEETTQRVNAALKEAGLSKRMTSSGASSDTTTRLAQRAGATGSGTVGSAIINSAKSGGAAGAMVGAGIETVSGVIDLVNGKRDVVEVGGAVAKAGAKGYVTGAAASAAATATGAAIGGTALAAGTGMLATTAVVAAPLAVAIGVGWAVSSLFEGLFD